MKRLPGDVVLGLGLRGHCVVRSATTIAEVPTTDEQHLPCASGMHSSTPLRTAATTNVSARQCRQHARWWGSGTGRLRKSANRHGNRSLKRRRGKDATSSAGARTDQRLFVPVLSPALSSCKARNELRALTWRAAPRSPVASISAIDSVSASRRAGHGIVQAPVQRSLPSPGLAIPSLIRKPRASRCCPRHGWVHRGVRTGTRPGAWGP